jgi:hypothetical protein
MREPLTVRELTDRPDLLEAARLAVENVLVEYRDSRISVMRNNGLVIRESDGRDSSIVRLGIEHAIAIGLRAILESEERHARD